LTSELGTDAREPTVAYRGRHRWVQTFEPFASQAAAESAHLPPLLRERGVYLLTGGLSGVALALAEFLAKTVRARLVLTGRKALPEREEWSARLAANGDADEETSRRIRRVEELEALGAEVLVLCADVSDEAQMREVLSRIERRFGALDAVIHGAALNGAEVDKEILSLTPDDCERHLRVKARGLLVLEKILRDRKVDFCLTLSSLSSVLGGLAFTAYAASNIFVDTLVQNHNRTSDERWMTVNWDAWNLEGAGGDIPSTRSKLAELSILPHEGAEAFRRILSMPHTPQVVVSTSDLQARLDLWVAKRRSADAPPEREAEAPSQMHARPELQNSYVAPENELEQEIAGIWQELLGISQIGLHDNFFELGGHSLLATMLISRLRKAFGIELQLRDMFEAPTVGGLSLAVAQRVIEQHDKENIAQLLEELPGAGLSASQNQL
jgi:NAD(P)-dependent dehydrogenase (short-subunit alcohol dehydrogenase family)/acyl carrier protein